MSHGTGTLEFSRQRIVELLDLLQRLAAGEKTALPLSPAHDELDAIAHAVNVLADELHWTNARIADAERQRAAEHLKAKEDAERANEAKSVFLRTASHEIRTPIAAILGIADSLAFSGLSEDDRQLIERLRVNSRALLSLVGNVLDLSRLDADKMALTIERISPLELASEVVKGVEAEARGKMTSMRVESVVPASFRIDTDRARLRQILVNVISNAVKFTTRGEIVVAIHSEHFGDAQYLTIDVNDTGIGIDAEQRQQLFVPFGQADSAIGRVHGGTGLGLALSSRLAERLGGSLELRWSVPGKGSAFRLRLSATAAGEAQPMDLRLPAQHPTLERPALEGVRVLLADDHQDLRMAIGRSLQMDGASITYARDGAEAFELAKNGTFDVVLMDILMPVMTGLEATRALRAHGFRVPIIAISADAAPEMRAVTLRAGCDAQLSKPFDPSDLTLLIQSVRSGAAGVAAD